MEEFDSNYRYILVAARRARQLQGGARPKVESKSRKACRIAMDEVAAGKVEWTKNGEREPAAPAAEPQE
ncbi:MAG: DNA-directed RNA polymerase subunit omega [Acidobacteria bacterium]|nr:DNA-directed RNA polymerase subunit omega [Acidobacteriota bacterium]